MGCRCETVFDEDHISCSIIYLVLCYVQSCIESKGWCRKQMVIFDSEINL